MQHSRARWRSYVIGDRAFYRAVVAILLPIVIQNGISSFVNLLDNIMVGRLGDFEMAGVSIANNLFFVYNICIFGGISGASIYGAQFFGARDFESMRAATRYKLYVGVGLCAVATVAFLMFDTPLLSLFLSKSESADAIAATMNSAKDYLRIMLIGLLPFAITQTYSSTLREGGETMLPMISGVAAVATNLVFNYILIFGHFGAPPLGVAGAAIATVMSRYVELGILVITTHIKKKRYFFMVGLYRTLKVPLSLVGSITRRGLPLLANESLWSFGMTFLMQLYSVRGLGVVTAMSISNTVSNLFNTVLFAMGNAVAIMVGQALGANEMEKAKQTAWRLVSVNLLMSVIIGLALSIASPFIPYIYEVSSDARALATTFMLILAGSMPIMAPTHCSYFILRSGGKTVITFIFDCLSLWVLQLPLVYCLVHFTDMGIIGVYAVSQFSVILKCVFGLLLVKKGVWINNITVSG